jgi:RNA polymerase sigma-54 factor
MALEIKQTPKLVQQLVITPQLQQAIKLLQLTRLELVDMINQEMRENPLLDDEEEANREESQETAHEKAEAEAEVPGEGEHTTEVKGQGEGVEDFDSRLISGRATATPRTGPPSRTF